jgi:hypothetical protein
MYLFKGEKGTQPGGGGRKTSPGQTAELGFAFQIL